MAENAIFLSVIIPCYNESENLAGGVLDEVYAFLDTLDFAWELIISDDGSSDNSRGLAQKFAAGRDRVFLLKNSHGGKPAAIYAGILKARGEYLLFSDLDQSTPMKELRKFIPYLREFDAVIGSRIERKNFPWYRRIGSQVFKSLRKMLLLKKIDDTQCGFKAFKTGLIREIFPKLRAVQKKGKAQGWKVTSFDVELLHLIEIRHKRIKEVPVEWEDRDLAKGKNRKYLKESWEMLLEILRVKVNDWRGFYKKF
ncbi:MAG: glycosyltransferase [Bacillota bacterium]